MSLPSAGNMHEGWWVRAKRIKAQRMAARLALGGRAHRDGFLSCVSAAMRGESLIVTLTRVSPRKLDSDNLAFAFKGVRDQVAAELGIDDGSDAIGWHYAQAKGPAGIRIEVSAVVP